MQDDTIVIEDGDDHERVSRDRVVPAPSPLTIGDDNNTADSTREGDTNTPNRIKADNTTTVCSRKPHLYGLDMTALPTKGLVDIPTLNSKRLPTGVLTNRIFGPEPRPPQGRTVLQPKENLRSGQKPRVETSVDDISPPDEQHSRDVGVQYKAEILDKPRETKRPSGLTTPSEPAFKPGDDVSSPPHGVAPPPAARTAREVRRKPVVRDDIIPTPQWVVEEPHGVVSEDINHPHGGPNPTMDATYTVPTQAHVEDCNARRTINVQHDDSTSPKRSTHTKATHSKCFVEIKTPKGDSAPRKTTSSALGRTDAKPSHKPSVEKEATDSVEEKLETHSRLEPSIVDVDDNRALSHGLGKDAGTDTPAVINPYKGGTKTDIESQYRTSDVRREPSGRGSTKQYSDSHEGSTANTRVEITPSPEIKLISLGQKKKPMKPTPAKSSGESNRVESALEYKPPSGVSVDSQTTPIRPGDSKHSTLIEPPCWGDASLDHQSQSPNRGRRVHFASPPSVVIPPLHWEQGVKDHSQPSGSEPSPSNMDVRNLKSDRDSHRPSRRFAPPQSETEGLGQGIVSDNRRTVGVRSKPLVSSDTNVGADEFVIDKVVGHAYADDGELLYHVMWFGYPPEEDTWEPTYNLPRSHILRYLKRHKLTIPPSISQARTG